MDRGACRATVHGVMKSWTQLSNYHFHCAQSPYIYSVIHIQYSFWLLFYYSLLQDIEYSSLSYTVGSCLSILYIVVCIC